jgi:hypothetical protein
LKQRKIEGMPHISYDLDGDGYVGGRDLVIAKHFDKDEDGRLNTAEKANAMDALKNGYEDNFVWGIEQSGPQGHHRLLQKRGVFVRGENFIEVGTSYPQHHLNKEP